MLPFLPIRCTIHTDIPMIIADHRRLTVDPLLPITDTLRTVHRRKRQVIMIFGTNSSREVAPGMAFQCTKEGLPLIFTVKGGRDLRLLPSDLH